MACPCVLTNCLDETHGSGRCYYHNTITSYSSASNVMGSNYGAAALTVPSDYMPVRYYLLVYESSEANRQARSVQNTVVPPITMPMAIIGKSRAAQTHLAKMLHQTQAQPPTCPAAWPSAVLVLTVHSSLTRMLKAPNMSIPTRLLQEERPAT